MASDDDDRWAWRAWLDAVITEDAAFRAVTRHGRLGTTRLGDRAIADMIKRRAQHAGVAGDFAGHSLRAGFATEALRPRHPRASDHAPRPMAISGSDARLRRRRRRVE
jgi:site-specific recombinase XerC